MTLADALGRRRRNKFGNRKVECDGYKFDSRYEALCYGGLRLREKIGDIQQLGLQRRWQLTVNGEKICTYVSDFDFYERGGIGGWTFVVADAKGFKTPLYKLKAKLMKAIHGIEIREL